MATDVVSSLGMMFAYRRGSYRIKAGVLNSTTTSPQTNYLTASVSYGDATTTTGSETVPGFINPTHMYGSGSANATIEVLCPAWHMTTHAYNTPYKASVYNYPSAYDPDT